MDARETSVYVAMLIAALIIGGIFVFHIISTASHQREMRRLYYARILAEVTALEKDRLRIAADLHDALAPLLSAIKLSINELGLSNPEDQQELLRVNDLLDDAIARIRSITADLMPDTLARKGLSHAIAAFTGRINNGNTLQVDYNHSEVPALPDQVAMNLYRIVQELVHNTIKHSKAAHLVIRLFTKQDQLVLVAEDDGIGFDYEKALKDENGLGLRNILSRTDLVNGNLFVDSGKNIGTRYTIKIPIAV